MAKSSAQGLGLLIWQVGQNDPQGLFQPWTRSGKLLPPREFQRRDGWSCHLTCGLLTWFDTNRIAYFIIACETKVVKESISITFWVLLINGYRFHFQPPRPHSHLSASYAGVGKKPPSVLPPPLLLQSSSAPDLCASEMHAQFPWHLERMGLGCVFTSQNKSTELE